MAKLPTRNRLFRAIWTADSFVSTALFEAWDGCKRAGSAYSSFLHRYFLVRGFKRLMVGLIDDGLTLGTLFAFGLLAFALPPFSGTGDIWNRGRDYAMTFTDSNGNIVGKWGIRQNDAIPLDEISPNLIKAVLATEDVRFFEHFGIDLIGTLRAVVNNARSSTVQGGSSITQQVAKNLFLSPEQTVERKIREAFLSLWIESHLSKEEILKLYLDRSYLGAGTHGVEAASQFYFGKSARDVSVSEASMIAAIFKSPTNYAPHIQLEAARARSNVVLYRMLDAGFISQGELLQARRSPAQVVAAKDAATPSWFLEWAYENTLDVLEENGLQKEFVIEVKTTVDLRLQLESQNIINDTIDTLGPENGFSQAASITMAPDGAVRAIIGGRDFEKSNFNRAADAERQTGSSFKPFVYLAALLDGHRPDEIVVDGPVSVGGWSPGNYKDKYSGAMTLTTALAKSANSIPVKLMQEMGGKAGREKIIKAAHDVGIQAELETWPPMVLGTTAMTLLDLTTGYATFAGGGKLARPYAVLEIRRANGNVIYERTKKVAAAPQVVPVEVIADLNSMLGQVIKAGTARSADLAIMPAAGKTGTNQAYRDAWFVGFTAHNVTGVWVGNDDNTSMNDVTGGRIPAPAWKRITLVAETGLEPEGFVGMPFDESYVLAAAELEKKRQEEAGLVTDDVGDTLLPAINEETPAATTEPAAGDANDVLKGMFALFEDSKPRKINAQGTRKTKRKAKAGSPVQAARSEDGESLYGLPKTAAERETKRGFFERLFTSEPRKKKRKKKQFFEF